MKKQKVVSIVTWIVTIMTAILWMPLVAMGIFVLKGYITKANSVSEGIIGGADGPTALYISTSTFGGGIIDFIILGGMLLLTIVLWYRSIKLKSNKKVGHSR